MPRQRHQQTHRRRTAVHRRVAMWFNMDRKLVADPAGGPGAENARKENHEVAGAGAEMARVAFQDSAIFSAQCQLAMAHKPAPARLAPKKTAKPAW